MEQLKNLRAHSLVVIPFGEIADRATDFMTPDNGLIRDFSGRVFMITPLEERIALFPVLENGAVSKHEATWDPSRTEMVSIVDPRALGIKDIGLHQTAERPAGMRARRLAKTPSTP